MRRIGRPPTCTCGDCRKCKRAAYMREWWSRWTPEQKREKIAQRDPERVSRDYAKRQRKRRKEHAADRLEKERAHKSVQMAIERGELVRPLHCEECGGLGRRYRDGRARIHAHHDDYGKPLKVRWLCGDCHGAVHGFGAQEAA
jgi:hypothetical protein